MSDFEQAIQFVLRWEGGYVNHPSDPGGATNHGISIRFLQRGSIFLDLDRDGDMDANDIRLLSRGQAVELYRQNFWVPIRGYDLPGNVAVAVMDTAVNMGVSVGAKFLQRVVGTTDDGMIGPITLAALGRYIQRNGAGELVVNYLTRRMKRYTELSTFGTFGTGWTRRAFACQDYATSLAWRANP